MLLTAALGVLLLVGAPAANAAPPPGAANIAPPPGAANAAPAPGAANAAPPPGAANAAPPPGAANAAPPLRAADSAPPPAPAIAARDAGLLPEAQPYAMDVQVAPEEVTLGEHIALTISVEHEARDVYSLPGFDPAPLAAPKDGPLPRLRREQLPSGRVRTLFELVLVDYGTLEPRLPDLTLSVSGPEGPRQLSVRGRPLKFRSLVAEEGQAAPDQAHHGPKPPVPVLVRSFLWLGLLGALLSLGALLTFWKVLTKRKLRVKREVTHPLEADEVALQRLDELRAAAPSMLARGEGRAAIFTLSEIVRGYLGARLHFSALDLTSEEFLAELHHRRLMGLDLAGLTEEVRWEDLVKFAKLEPTEQECLRGISHAESMIRHTRPLRAQPAGRAA